MSYQPSEIVNLILLLGLAPVIFQATRHFRSPVASAVYVAMGCMLAAYISTILEGFVLFDLFNAFEHVFYALAGAAFLTVVVLATRGLVRERVSDS